jgi:hypothetical protein
LTQRRMPSPWARHRYNLPSHSVDSNSASGMVLDYASGDEPSLAGINAQWGERRV